MERTPFRTIKNVAMMIRQPTAGELADGKAKHADVVLVAAGTRGKILAIIPQDFLFDADGNRFKY